MSNGISSTRRAKRDQNLRQRYGISLEQYEKLLEYQGGMCAICGGQPDTSDGVFAVDHDHATGSVRSLLCKSCNTALGNIKDDPAVAERITKYLSIHKPIPTLPLPVGSLIESGDAPIVRAGEALGAERTAVDPRIPTPEVVAALKATGLKAKEIAEEFQISLRTTKQLLSDAQRGSVVRFAQDYLLDRTVPKMLAALDDAMEEGDKKTAVELAKGLGVLRKDPDPIPTEKGVSFEELRASLIVRKYASDPAGPESTVDSETVIDVSPIKPSAEAGADQSSGQEGYAPLLNPQKAAERVGEEDR